MDLRAVSDRPNVTGISVTGWWPHRSPLCQRRSTCSPENQAWWSWSAAEVPQYCIRWGTEGKAKVCSCDHIWIRDGIQLFMNWFRYYKSRYVFRLMQDHTEGSSMHSQALETLQERLREAETALRREQDSYRQMQVHIMPSTLFNPWRLNLDWTRKLFNFLILSFYRLSILAACQKWSLRGRP